MRSFIGNLRHVCLMLVGGLPAACALSEPRALAQALDPAPQQLRVMTWNVEWMFDDYQGDNRSQLAREQSAPTAEYWQSKLSGVVEVLAAHPAEIVALQEIEGSQTLRAICQRLQDEHQLSYRYAFIEGSDGFTEQDVGLLVRSGLWSYRRHEQSQVMFDSRNYFQLSKHLVAELRWDQLDSPLTVMNVHLRARPEVAPIRVRQARLMRVWLQPLLEAGQDVIVVGDLNAERPVPQPLAQGADDDELAVLAGDQPESALVDLLTYLPDPQQATHAVLDEQFDRILVSPSLLRDDPGVDWCFQSIVVLDEATIRGAADGPGHWDQRLRLPPEELDLSDHFPVLATFERK